MTLEEEAQSLASLKPDVLFATAVRAGIRFEYEECSVHGKMLRIASGDLYGDLPAAVVLRAAELLPFARADQRRAAHELAQQKAKLRQLAIQRRARRANER